jgi:hypothetical protein
MVAAGKDPPGPVRPVAVVHLDAAEHHLRVSDDDRQGRPELVRHVCQEVALGATRPFGCIDQPEVLPEGEDHAHEHGEQRCGGEPERQSVLQAEGGHSEQYERRKRERAWNQHDSKSL